jgi:hypothetical protein
MLIKEAKEINCIIKPAFKDAGPELQSTCCNMQDRIKACAG